MTKQEKDPCLLSKISFCNGKNLLGRINRMSVMLIRPMTPETSRSGIVSIQYPINIGYLLSYLKKHDVACSVKDFEVEQFSENEFIEATRKKGPKIIGFSCMTPHIIHAAYIAKLAKDHFPDILTVVGGVHATAIPEQTLNEFPQFDVIVRGEGEQTLLELYQKWSSSKMIKDVQGIAFRDGSNIRLNPLRALIENLDQTPFPERSLIPIDNYKKSHVTRGISRKVVNIAEMISSRGCPYDCIFCASKVIHTRKVRFRSAENVIAEMEEIIKEYKVKHFSFLDDTFTIKKKQLYPICEFIKSEKATFDCLTRVNDIDEEKIAIMAASGCKKISFGIESGSPKVLKLIKKGITIEQIKRAFYIVKKAKIPIVEASFMIGSHPDETMEDIKMTKKLIFDLRPDILALFIAIPYPGTELNKLLKERGFLKEEKWGEFKLVFGNPSWKLCEIPMKKLQQIMKKIYFYYYLNPLYLFTSILKIKSYKELKYLADTGLSLVRYITQKT